MVKKVIPLLLFVCSWSLCAQQRYMDLQEIVTDSAGTFNSGQLSELKEKLSGFELKTTNQLVVVTVERLGFESIETYANGLFNQNGIGQEGKDNGLLVLFSHQDRQVRIEVGYGLEPYITDAVASRIIRNTMIPNFKEERYYEGIFQGVDQIMAFLNNPEALEEFKAEIEEDEKMDRRIGFGFLFLFLSVFVGFGGFYFYRSYTGLIEILRGVLIGKLGIIPGLFMIFASALSALFGLIFLGVPLAIVLTLFKQEFLPKEAFLENPLVALWVLAPFFGIALLIAFVKIKFFGNEDFELSLLKNDKTYYRKTFSSSGTHSFGSSSSGGSSSSFSGGGGSSGGGGASGSW